MLKDSKHPPRSLDTFGVSGLLAAECEVFYENLYSMRHIGRVSDLIAARLREAGLSELKLRTALLFTAFEGARAKMLETEQPYEDPVLVECGLDEEKIAIGVSFATGGTWMPALAGLENRITGGKPQDELERQLASLCRVADSLVLKISSDERRVELSAVLLLKRTPGAPLEKASEFILTRVDKEAAKESPKPQLYTELGDLDHASLLAPTGKGTSPGPSALEDSVVVRGKPEEAPELIRVSGAEAEAESSETVSKYQERIEELEKRLARSESGKGWGFSLRKYWPFGRGKEPEETVAEPEIGLPPEIAEPLLLDEPLAGDPERLVSATPKEREDETVMPEDFSQTALEAADFPKLKDPEEILTDAQLTIGEPELFAKRLTDEIHEGQFDRLFRQAKNEIPDIKKLIPNEAAKRWVDGFMESLVAEKSRLYELSLALNANLRKKELDFKVQEQKLLSELRIRDTLIRKKSTALVQATEKLSNSSLTIEKLKSGASLGKDDAIFKQRYAMAQKLLAASKKDNSDLLVKIMDLKGQLTKNRGPSPAEFMALKSKNERSLKQIEELKRTNQTFQDRLNAKPGASQAAVSLVDQGKVRGPTGAISEEMRKKLELANRNASKAQANTDQLTLKLEEQDQEVARLKRELLRANTELKMKGTASGDGTGTPPPIAA